MRFQSPQVYLIQMVNCVLKYHILAITIVELKENCSENYCDHFVEITTVDEIEVD